MSVSNKCVVHWDGKLVKDFLEKEDRLAVLVSDYSGAAEGKILEIPVIKSSSGVEQANAVIQALRKWDLEEHVIGQFFHTTTSNTGHENGAAVIVERFMKKKLLWLACRHHVYELILKQVISEIFGCTSAPVNTKFVAFQRERNTIDKSLEMRSLPITCLWLQIRRDQVIAVTSEMLSDKKSFFVMTTGN